VLFEQAATDRRLVTALNIFDGEKSIKDRRLDDGTRYPGM